MSTATSRTFQSARCKGFSLVELLTCIAVIGLIAAMALPSLAGIIDQGTSAKSRQQAHCLAQTYASAKAAGAVFADASLQGVVEALASPGGVQGRGVFAAMNFRVMLDAPEKAAMLQSSALVAKTLADGSMQLEYRADAIR